MSEIRGRKKCTLREIRSILEHLNFACRVISLRRTFCSRLAQAMAGVKVPHHYIRITRDMHYLGFVWGVLRES